MNEKIKCCEENDHCFIKIAEERRCYLDEYWNAQYYKVYIMCCQKCGKTREIRGGCIV